MTQQEINNKISEMIENRSNAGFDRMKNMPVCKKFFNELVNLGCEKMAETFKSIVFYTTLLHPEMTDREIFLDFAKKQNMI